MHEIHHSGREPSNITKVKVTILPLSLTWCSVHGHVSEVAPLDDLHGQTASGSVVGQAHQQLWHAAMLKGLGGGR